MPLYFRRWELLQSDELLDVLPLQSLLHEDPEKVLEVLFIVGCLLVRSHFPLTSAAAARPQPLLEHKVRLNVACSSRLDESRCHSLPTLILLLALALTLTASSFGHGLTLVLTPP